MANDNHLDEFFGNLWRQYISWKSGRAEALKPEFSIGHEINASVFSYSGYDETDSFRDQGSKDEVAVDMLERAIDRDCVVYDCGTFDGKRLHRIIDALPGKSKEKIRSVYGIEANPQSLQLAEDEFRGSRIPFQGIHGRIEGLLSDTGFMHETSRSSPWQQDKRIILGLENIFLNINRLAKAHHDGLSGFVRSIMDPNDEVILEVHGMVDRDCYSEEVESFFHNYLSESGVMDVVQPSLGSDYTKYGKRVFLHGLPERFRYKELEFDFDEKHPPVVYIGFSGCLPYDTLFEYLVFNFANNVFVPETKDVQFTGSDISIRFRAFDKDKWLREAAENPVSSTDDGALRFGLVNYIINKELYPYYYHRFLYKPSTVSGLEESEMEMLQERHRHSRRVFPQTSSERLQYDGTESRILRL